MTTNQEGNFMLPATKPCPGEAHALIVGQTTKGKSVMPDNSDLTMELTTKAFQMLGQDHFEVSANLSVDNPESLRNFGRFQSMLLMAYQEGQLAARTEDAAREAGWLKDIPSN